MAHVSQSRDNPAARNVLNKALATAEPMVDPHWQAMLDLHAAAAAGDADAIRRWTAVKSVDPRVAALVPQLAEARRPAKVGKQRKVVSKRYTDDLIPVVPDDDSDLNQSFEDFTARVSAGRAASYPLSTASHYDRPAKLPPVADPAEFNAFVGKLAGSGSGGLQSPAANKSFASALTGLLDLIGEGDADGPSFADFAASLTPTQRAAAARGGLL